MSITLLTSTLLLIYKSSADLRRSLAAMTAEDWSRVIKMNKVLYGFVVESDVEGPKLVKARSPGCRFQCIPKSGR